jgi:GT2 family glycosyltransferase
VTGDHLASGRYNLHVDFGVPVGMGLGVQDERQTRQPVGVDGAVDEAQTITPALSVIIASVNGYPYLAECLLSLERQTVRERLEVIVVDRLGDGTAEQAEADFPRVRVLRAPRNRSVPQLRSEGLRVARGAVVAITEDHVVAPPGWASAILSAHARYPAAAAIGGPVDNHRTASALDWASFLCEYSEFLPPLPAVASAAIPGMNTSYKRRAIEACGDLFYAGVWETFLHARLLDLGEELRADPAILLHHNKSFGWGEFLSQRYYLARSFAGMRVAGAGLARKAAFALASPALLPLLTWRIARRSLRKGYGAQLRRAAPVLLLFLLAWSAGEGVGYAFGEGDASARVE